MTTDRRRGRARRAARARRPTLTAPSPKVSEGVESWWPPERGDRLRYPTLHVAGPGRVRAVDAALDVLAVFPHEGETLITTAEWLPGKRRWVYETYTSWRAEDLQLRPSSRPARAPTRREKKAPKDRAP